MSKFHMNKLTTVLALAVCFSLSAFAAEAVPKEKGSRAKELEESKANAQPIKPIVMSGLKGIVVPPAPANATKTQPVAVPGAATEPQ